MLRVALLRCGRGAKGLRILICSLQTNTSELPMRRLPSRGCVFAMPLGCGQSQPWAAAANCAERDLGDVSRQGCTGSEDRWATNSETNWACAQGWGAGRSSSFAGVVYLAARTQERACSRLFTVQSADQPHGSQKTPYGEHTYLFQRSTKSVPVRIQETRGGPLTRLKDPQGRANSPGPVPKI